MASVVARLTDFVQHQLAAGLPETVLHEANRLIVNQLKASVGAVTHPTIGILHDWAQASRGRGAHILWFGTETSAEHAAFVNAALFEVLDFNETYIPTFQHAVSGVLPAVLAEAECRCHSGNQVLRALAIGIEVELACAAILMPTGYFRGFIPGGLTGAIGGATACAILRNLPAPQMRNAIGLAMNNGGGVYQSAGSAALPYVMGATARNGLVACELAARGLEAPDLSFEGDKGMLSSYSDEKPAKIDTVLSSLGAPWRIMGQSYKTVPTETITHAPIECVLVLRARAAGRVPARLRFGVAAIVVGIATERATRFGTPSSDLEARFDLRFCAAAAWVRGCFTLAEMAEQAYKDTDILRLRELVELVADAEHPTFEGASLDILYEDGSADRTVVHAFRGTPGNPMTDTELSAVLRSAAAPVMSPARAETVLCAAWALPRAPDVSALMSAACLQDIAA